MRRELTGASGDAHGARAGPEGRGPADPPRTRHRALT